LHFGGFSGCRFFLRCHEKKEKKEKKKKKKGERQPTKGGAVLGTISSRHVLVTLTTISSVNRWNTTEEKWRGGKEKEGWYRRRRVLPRGGFCTPCNCPISRLMVLIFTAMDKRGGGREKKDPHRWPEEEAAFTERFEELADLQPRSPSQYPGRGRGEEEKKRKKKKKNRIHDRDGGGKAGKITRSSLIWRASTSSSTGP